MNAEVDTELTAERKNDFSKGSIPATILRLALPMTVAQLINIMYSVVDRMYLGLGNTPDTGRLALTGVGISLPLISILIGVANLCGTGGAPLCSISRGKGEDDEAERILGNAFVLLLVFGVVLTAGVLIFIKPLLYMFGASDGTYGYASSYLAIYMCGTIFVMISLGLNPFITSQGFAKTGMASIAIGAVVNIALDPIFIFTLKMGVSGAALATIIAQFCSAMWVLKFLTGKRAIIRLRLSCMKLELRRVTKIISLGLSGLCMSLTNSLIQIVCNITLQKYGGDLYVGVITVINAIREVMFMPVSGMNNGTTPVIGYNYGAGEYERVRKATRFSITVTVVYSAVMWAVLMLFPGTLIKMFNGEAELLAAGIPALRVYFLLFIFMSLQMSSQVIFVSLGMAKYAIFFSLLRKAFIAAPLTVILPLFGMGTDGVFIAEAISQFIGGVACFGTMYFVVYRRLAEGHPGGIAAREGRL